MDRAYNASHSKQLSVFNFCHEEIDLSFARHTTDLGKHLTRHATRVHSSSSHVHELGSQDEGFRKLAAHPRTVDHEPQGAHEAWVSWLRRVKWDWFVTIGYGPHAQQAQSETGIRAEAQKYIEALRATQSTAYALMAVEKGGHLGSWHCHLLVGGLGAHGRWAGELERLWRARGPVHVVRYDPELDPGTVRHGACAYLVKQWPAPNVDIVGKLRKHRPRRPPGDKPQDTY